MKWIRPDLLERDTNSKTHKEVRSPKETSVSFGEMIEDRGRYSIVVTVTKDFGSGPITKTVTLTLT